MTRRRFARLRSETTRLFLLRSDKARSMSARITLPFARGTMPCRLRHIYQALRLLQGTYAAAWREFNQTPNVCWGSGVAGFVAMGLARHRMLRVEQAFKREPVIPSQAERSLAAGDPRAAEVHG